MSLSTMFHGRHGQLGKRSGAWADAPATPAPLIGWGGGAERQARKVRLRLIDLCITQLGYGLTTRPRLPRSSGGGVPLRGAHGRSSSSSLLSLQLLEGP